MGSNPAGGVGVCYECCVWSSRDLCDEMITRPEGTYRMWRFRNLKNEEAMASCCATAPREEEGKKEKEIRGDDKNNNNNNKLFIL